MNSISLIISITIPIFSILVSFLSYTLELQPIYAQSIILSYILGVLAGVTFRDNQINRIGMDRKFTYFISAIIIAVAIILVTYCFIIKPEIKIEYPTNAQTINAGRTKVTGVAKNIPKGTKLWLVVYYVGRKIFYLQQEVTANREGKWEGEIILASGNTDYFIWAIIADEIQIKWLKNPENIQFEEWKHSPEYFDKIKVSRPAAY